VNDRQVWRWTGAFGVASGVLTLVGQPLHLVSGIPPRLQDTIPFSDYVAKNHNIVLTRSLVDSLIVASLLVFLAGFRHLIRQARAEYEWAATLAFGAGLAWGILVLVGDALEGASALDTIGSQADPAAVRALWEGSLAAFGGIGLIMAALFAASAGYAILATGALPRWIGWVAFLTAILNLAAAPSIYGGTGATGFYAADGLASIIGLLPLLIWILITSIAMITMREARAPKPAHPRRR